MRAFTRHLLLLVAAGLFASGCDGLFSPGQPVPTIVAVHDKVAVVTFAQGDTVNGWVATASGVRLVQRVIVRNTSDVAYVYAVCGPLSFGVSEVGGGDVLIASPVWCYASSVAAAEAGDARLSYALPRIDAHDTVEFDLSWTACVLSDEVWAMPPPGCAMRWIEPSDGAALRLHTWFWPVDGKRSTHVRSNSFELTYP